MNEAMQVFEPADAVFRVSPGAYVPTGSGRYYIEIILSIYYKYKLCVYASSPTGTTPGYAPMILFPIVIPKTLFRN